MDERPKPTEFVYYNIELYKSESLGSGSYGGVCKAQCDGLLCAAKIMHPTLFDLRDPGAATYLSKFREECHLLSLARHPNIVQYLGTFTDPDTRLPVLLMELCEESLTAFLERSPGPLSYHVQVDICHDIALALVYLHSNGLIHRDLTGNNILMIAGPRAKITDFGMSKLARVNPHMSTLTLCPGNKLYMPPEALDEANSYTAKLDIFSLGVLILQIVTRKFPDPSNRFHAVRVVGYHEDLIRKVPELERRKEHLDIVPSSHPLKVFVAKCMTKEGDRPSALDLTNELSKLKQSVQYDKSILHRGDVKESEIVVGASDRVVSRLKKMISEKDLVIQQQCLQLEAANELLKELSVSDRSVVDISKRNWSRGKDMPEALCRGTVVVHENIAYVRPAGTNRVYSYTNTPGKENWIQLPDNVYENFGLTVVCGVLTSIGGKKGKITTNILLSLKGEERKRKWLEIFPSMPTPRSSTVCISTENALIVAGGLDIHCKLPVVEVLALDTREWSVATPLPEEGWLWSSTVCNNTLYLAGGSSNLCATKSVYACLISDLLKSCSAAGSRKGSYVWHEVGALPVTASTLFTLRESVFAVGGRDHGVQSSDIYTYDQMEDTWKVVTSMKNKLALCIAFVLPHNNCLTIVGGYHGKSKSQCVFILN